MHACNRGESITLQVSLNTLELVRLQDVYRYPQGGQVQFPAYQTRDVKFNSKSELATVPLVGDG